MKRRFAQFLEDFWLGDQLCSLCFSFSSLLVIFCLWRDGSGNCEVESHWSLPFVLNALPSFIRFIQCVRRYIDSHLYTHLINVSSAEHPIVGLYCILTQWLIEWEVPGRHFLLSILYVVEISWLAASWSNLRSLLHSRILIICLWIGMGEHTKLRWIVLSHLRDVQDLLMDWSIMEPHAKHAFLRQNLIYMDAIPVSGCSPNNMHCADQKI